MALPVAELLRELAAIVAARGKDLDLVYVRATLHALEQALDRRDLLPALDALVEGVGG